MSILDITFGCLKVTTCPAPDWLAIAPWSSWSCRTRDLGSGASASACTLESGISSLPLDLVVRPVSSPAAIWRLGLFSLLAVLFLFCFLFLYVPVELLKSKSSTLSSLERSPSLGSSLVSSRAFSLSTLRPSSWRGLSPPDPSLSNSITDEMPVFSTSDAIPDIYNC